MANYRISIDEAMEGLRIAQLNAGAYQHGQLGYAVRALDERREIDADVRRLAAMVSERDAEVERLRQNVEDLQTVLDVTDRALTIEADRAVAAEAEAGRQGMLATKNAAIAALAAVVAVVLFFAALSGCYPENQPEPVDVVSVQIVGDTCRIVNYCDQPIVIRPMGRPGYSADVPCDAWSELGRGELIFPGQNVACIGWRDE